MTDRSPDLEVLDTVNNEGYGYWPLPCQHDEEIDAVLRTIIADGTHVEFGHALTLGAFAFRMAILARREENPERLRRGLVAAAVASVYTDDIRDVIPRLSLLWRSAVVIGLDAKAEFEFTEETVGADGALEAFAARAPEDQTIDVMGYIEVEDEDGFRYEYTR